MASPVITRSGQYQNKTSSTNVGPCTTASLTWSAGDLLIAHLGEDAVAGTVTFSAVANFGAWTTAADNQVGSGTSGVRNIAAWCQCAIGYTGTASVTATLQNSTVATVLELFRVTGTDPAAAGRGQNVGTATNAVPAFTVTVTAGSDFDGATLVLGASAIRSGTAATTSAGWAATGSSATTYGTTGGSSASNISVSWAARR